MLENSSFLHKKTSINTQEIHRFGKIASKWWDENGPFKPLHQLNPTRIQFIRDALIQHFKCDPRSPRPLEGLNLLDIGCGGGLVAECLTRLGATVTGIDASDTTIAVATQHAEQMGLEINYRLASAEDLAAEGCLYDSVLALEVVEHVEDVAFFLKTCTTLVKPGGTLILSTLNRTWKSWMLAIVGAEYVLQWLPRGTHDWKKFLAPSELAEHLRPTGFQPQQITGMVYNPLQQTWSLSRDLDVNYLMSCG